jgi:hypothetical protein
MRMLDEKQGVANELSLLEGTSLSCSATAA